NLDLQMVGAERFQEIARIEYFASRKGTCLLLQPASDTYRCLHHHWSRNRVNVASARYGTALLVSSPHGYVEQECLSRASTFICRCWRWGFGITNILHGFKIHVGVNLRRSQMAGHRYDFGERQCDHALRSERCRKVPFPRCWRIV